MTMPTAGLPVSAARLSASLVWGYIHHELIYITWAIMEVALLTPFCFALMRWVQFWPPSLFMVCLLLLMLLPFNLARLMSVLEFDREQQRGIMIGALLLTVLVGWRTLFYQPDSLLDFRWLRDFFANLAEINNLLWLRDLSLFLLITFVWWRGLRLVGRYFSIAGAGLRLRVGGLILAPLVIWFANGRLAWSLSPFILLFFLAGLTTVALIRAEEVEQSKSGRSASLDPRWLTAVFLAALLVVVLAHLITLLVAGDPAQAAVSWLAPLWTALILGGTVIANILFYLILPLFKLIGWLVEMLAAWLAPFMSRLATPTPNPTLGPLDFPLQATRAAPTAVGGSPSIKLITILLMVAVVLVVTLALGQFYRQAELAARRSEQTSSSPDTPDSRLGRRLLRRFGLLRGWRTAASIRRIYQQMSQAAAASGFPRATAETPYEYLTTLATAWPDHTAETSLITQAYVNIRYGELPETQEELNQIQAAWKRLETTKPTAAAQAHTATIDLAKRTKVDARYE